MVAFLMRGGGLWQAIATTVVVVGNGIVAWFLWRRRERSTEGGTAAAPTLSVRRWVIPLLIVGVLMMGLSLWLVYG